MNAPNLYSREIPSLLRGLRTRLRVTTRDGAAHLFVVNRLGRVVDAIAAARGGLPV